eukprot:CFRG4032T1
MDKDNTAPQKQEEGTSVKTRYEDKVSKRPRLDGNTASQNNAESQSPVDISLMSTSTSINTEQRTMSVGDDAVMEDLGFMPDTADSGEDVPAIDTMEIEDYPSVIVENPTLDLDNYSSNFSGMALITRMIFIAAHAPSLKTDALKIALSTIKSSTTSTSLYVQVYSLLYPNEHTSMSKGNEDEDGNSVQPALDFAWIDETDHMAELEVADREKDIKSSRNKNIKLSVWVGYTDLGDFHYRRGDWENAFKSYMRARDYTTSGVHEVQMCENAIRASIQQKNWDNVKTFAARAERVKDFHKMLHKPSRIKCYVGIAHIANGDFEAAAQLFIQVKVDAVADWTEVVSPGTVALYGGLCALATMSRNMHKVAIDSPSFKSLFVHNADVQAITRSFCTAKYSDCLTKLDDIKPDLLLDVYLSNHVDKLFSAIREKIMIQYFHPFMSVSLPKMAIACNTDVNTLQSQLAALIVDGRLSARIDSHNKVMLTRQVNNRSTTYEKCRQLSLQHQQRTNASVLRSRMIVDNLIIEALPNFELNSNNVTNDESQSNFASTTPSSCTSRSASILPSMSSVYSVTSQIVRSANVGDVENDVAVLRVRGNHMADSLNLDWLMN